MSETGSFQISSMKVVGELIWQRSKETTYMPQMKSLYIHCIKCLEMKTSLSNEHTEN